MSDRVGSEGQTLPIQQMQDDANRLEAFQGALRSAVAAPLDVTATVPASPANSRNIKAPQRSAVSDRIDLPDQATTARPDQSARTSRGRAAPEGTLQSSGEDQRAQSSTKRSGVGPQSKAAPKRGAKARDDASEAGAKNGANDDTQSATTAGMATLGGTRGQDSIDGASAIATREPAADQDAALRSLEKAAVIETLQGLADGSLAQKAKDVLRAKAEQLAADPAASPESIQAAENLIGMIDGLEALAANVLANAPYDDAVFANLFDQLFWIRNWLTLFTDEPGENAITFEQSLDYSFNGAMAMPMELMMTRSLMEPLKPTEWDRLPSRLIADDPIVGLAPGSPEILKSNPPSGHLGS